MKLPIDYLRPTETLRGRNYGSWFSTWSNWLLGEQPDNFDGGDMLFLRGNIDYRYDERGQRVKEPGGFLNKMEDRGYKIPVGTAIFIPVITAMFTKVDRYEGHQTSDERSMRYAARKDIFEGNEMWLVYKELDPATRDWGDYQSVVPTLDVFLFETPYFMLTVESNSPLREKLEFPLDSGEYDTVTHGYVVIVTRLTPGVYRFKFGGKGRDEYYTQAAYDITVSGDLDNNSLDISGSPNIIPKFDPEKLKTTTGMSFKE